MVPGNGGSVIYNMAGGLGAGVSMKIRDLPHYQVTPAGILQLEYNIDNWARKDWFDVSWIDCNPNVGPENPSYCPFLAGGVLVRVVNERGHECLRVECHMGRCNNDLGYFKPGPFANEPSLDCPAGSDIFVTLGHKGNCPQTVDYKAPVYPALAPVVASSPDAAPSAAVGPGPIVGPDPVMAPGPVMFSPAVVASPVASLAADSYAPYVAPISSEVPLSQMTPIYSVAPVSSRAAVETSAIISAPIATAAPSVPPYAIPPYGSYPSQNASLAAPQSTSAPTAAVVPVLWTSAGNQLTTVGLVASLAAMVVVAMF